MTPISIHLFARDVFGALAGWRVFDAYIASALEYLTTTMFVGNNSNMQAELLFRGREGLLETAFVEIVIWRVPQAVRGSTHAFKYRLALVSENICVLRYDNEAGKGDHKHVGEREVPYRFIDLGTLQADFWKDVATWRAKQ